jgi:hypothetical protein
MTIIEAINTIDALYPNTYSPEQKKAQLSKLDGVIKRDIIDKHEGSEEITFNGYDENTPQDTVLLVPAPYDDIYIFWLQMWIDYWNGELARYNNSTAMYKTAYSNFERAYNREHMPKATKIKYF